MKIAALMLLILASSEVGMMSELRKIYQVKNGNGLVSTIFFMVLTMLFATISGMFFTGGNISFSTTSLLFSLLFAFICTVTSILCLVGTAWGNVSIIITCASLGKLVLPSTYAMIALPEENVLTIYKALGFLFAFVVLALNFISGKSEKKNKDAFKFRLACIIVFFTQGSALIISSTVTRLGIAVNEFVTQYNAVSVILMAIVLFILFLGKRDKFKDEIKSSMSKKSFLIIIGYALLSFTSDKFAITCTKMVPILFQAPVSFCVPIVVLALIDFLIYKEKPSKRNYIQIATAFLSCICFMI